MPGSRVDYEAIAHLYDAQPYRARRVDPQLRAFVAECRGALTVVDIGCGTGNQLIADRAALPALRYVGLDLSVGMLRQAARKAPQIGWIGADGAVLPLAAASVDYACCQFALHHVADKRRLLREAARVLRPGGRLVFHNICPQRSADWLYYEYFPETRLRDFEDFWSPETLVEQMTAVGFTGIETAFEQITFDQDLLAWLDIVRRRDTCSQLQAISDAAYRGGIERLERELAAPDLPRSRINRLCLLTMQGKTSS